MHGSGLGYGPGGNFEGRVIQFGLYGNSVLHIPWSGRLKSRNWENLGYQFNRLKNTPFAQVGCKRKGAERSVSKNVRVERSLINEG